MFEQLAEEAKGTIVFARAEAKRLGSSEITPEHILFALLSDVATVHRILEGVPVDEMRDELSASCGSLGESAVIDQFPLSDDAEKVLSMAAEEARQLNNEWIGNEHLLLGILRVASCEANNLLKRKGVTITTVRSAITDHREPMLSSKNSGISWLYRLRSLFSKRDKEAVLLRRIAHLVKSGRGRKALSLIDAHLSEPAEDHIDRVRKFAPQGAVIARAIRDVPQATKYYEMALINDGENVRSLYGMADVLEMHGDSQKAKEYAIRCYQLALLSEDKVNHGFIELLEKRFPELRTFR